MTRLATDLKHILTPRTLVRVARKLLANDAMALGGQLAYFFVLFLFPFLMFLISLVGLMIDHPETIFKTLVAGTQGFLPQTVIELLSNQFNRTLQSTSSLTFSIAVLLTFVMGTASTESLITGANRAYGVLESRPFWRRWVIAVFLILGFALLVATMAFVVLAPQTGDYLQRTLNLSHALMGFWGVFSWVIAFLNLTLAFDILYYVAPSADLTFKWITPGGLMTTVLLLVSSQLFILWANNIFRSSQLFGQLGASVVFLLWLFIIGLVVLAGVEINAELARAAEGHGNAENIEPSKDDS